MRATSRLLEGMENFIAICAGVLNNGCPTLKELPMVLAVKVSILFRCYKLVQIIIFVDM